MLLSTPLEEGPEAERGKVLAQVHTAGTGRGWDLAQSWSHTVPCARCWLSLVQVRLPHRWRCRDQSSNLWSDAHSLFMDHFVFQTLYFVSSGLLQTFFSDSETWGSRVWHCPELATPHLRTSFGATEGDLLAEVA